MVTKKKADEKVSTLVPEKSIEDVVDKAEEVSGVDFVEDSEEHLGNTFIKEQVVKSKVTPPKTSALITKDGRHYEGSASKLMNALYDGMLVNKESPMGHIAFDVADLDGWNRTSVHVAQACAYLEKAGWKKK